MRLKIAARSSDLARLQAYQVAHALKRAEPELKVEFEFRSSLGDQNPDVPLASWGSKGVFTQDFFEDLKSGRFDLVVHSWKDLPTEVRPGTKIAATLERADVRDLLLVPKEVWQDAKANRNLTILSSSPRRCHNLRSWNQYLPARIDSLTFQNVRGNVPTRLEKMIKEKCALIVAKAAVDRLLSTPEEEFFDLQVRLRRLLDQCHFMVLPLSVNPPAAAQGALAIEIAEDRSDWSLETVLNKINTDKTFKAVESERSILQSYGGGCHQKIGTVVLPKESGTWTVIRGVAESGQILDRDTWKSDQPAAPKAIRRGNVFPLLANENRWFFRESLSMSKFTAQALWVARDEAWPEGFEFSGPIWASGLMSWKKLAERGVWINGCAEGLGEEDPGLEILCGDLSWAKLTHDRAPIESSMPIVPTYRLANRPPSESPDLRGKTHFFWMSASSFERARELFPREMEAGFHGCGPGLTFDYLRKQGLRMAPKTYLNLADFLNEVLPT